LIATRIDLLSFQLETVDSSLQVDPDNSELQSLKTELEELITLTETSIAELKPPATASNPAPSPPKESWKDRGPPKPKAETEEAPPAPPASFRVNDNVLARWVSGDGSFYPARITSITGSSSNPIYLVTFKSYSTKENLTSKDIRPVAGFDRKRKADGTPGSSASPSPAPPPNVISAAADINPALANQARQEPSKAGDGPARPAKVPRKVKANKELEEGKNKWKDFAAKSKSKGKFGKKESMFRTGDSVNARGMCPLHEFRSFWMLTISSVGFTGSGQQMRKDPTRTRHIYQQAEDEGY
jgi:survival-of-motor-neuron-related-splicing factor 30